MEPDLARMAQLSRRYARYGHSLPGLSLALGGVIMLLMLLAPPFLANHLQVDPDGYRGLLALAVAVLITSWILAKEFLRQRIYQSLGIAEAGSSMTGTLFNRILALAIAVIALAYPVKVLMAVKPHPGSLPSAIQIYIGLTACLALPWCTVRFIRGGLEGLLWFLLCFWGLALAWTFPLAGVLFNGTGPLSAVLVLTLPLAYFGGLAIGLVQHFNFLRLAREIRAQETPDD